MLLVIVILIQQACLVLRPCQARHTLLVPNSLRYVVRYVLQRDILANFGKLLCILHNSFGLREQAELSGALVCNRFLWEVSRVLHSG